jgi:hypothetical protein
MPSRSRLRMLADYFAATRNEIAVDEMFLALSKMQGSNVGYIPRVPYWIDLASRKPYVTRNFSRVLRWFWLAGGSTAFFTAQYLKFAFIHRLISGLAELKSDGAILALSTRAYDTISPIYFPNLPTKWLTVPWVPKHRLSMGAQELPMLSILDKSDLSSSLADALAVTRRMKRNRSFSPWILQAYTAFRWFLLRRAMNRLEGVLVTTEHYDRWAVLVDRAVRESRRASPSFVNLIVVQHGAMGALNQEKSISRSSLNLPTKLRQVDELYAYNQDEADAFQAMVFANRNISRILGIRFFKPTIELTGDLISDRKRLLIVGHPICEPFHIEIFKNLKNFEHVEIFYKPHPKAPMSAPLVSVGWKIIKDSNFFPRVDLLVSYPSTLVIEYKNVGVPSFVHPLDINIDHVSTFIEKVKSNIV